MQRTLLIGAGTLCGTITARVARNLNRSDPEDADQDPSNVAASGVWTGLLTGPTSLFAAIGVSRTVAGWLDLEDDDRKGHFLLGVAIGGGMTLLSGPLRKLFSN